MSKILYSSKTGWHSSSVISCVNDSNQIEFHQNSSSPDSKTNKVFIDKCLPFLDFFAFDEKTAHLQKQDTGIIPPGLLFIDKNIIVYEKPPAYQNVFVIPKLVSEINYESDDPKVYRLPIPWQLYIVYHSNFTVTNVRMHFMDGPLNDINQQMYLAPLSNFYSSGDLCRPFFSDMDDIERYPKNVAGVMASSYDWVWNSGTNLDLTQCIVAYFYQDHILGEDFHKNSLLQNTDSKSFQRDSYYCSPGYVTHLYYYWEKFELHEVSFLSWPKNSKLLSFNDDYINARDTKLSQYINEVSSSKVFLTSECCEECVYYSDDGDYEDTPDCECSCHYSSEDINMDSFYEWAGLNPPPGVSFIESFTQFRKNNLIGQVNPISISSFLSNPSSVHFDKLYSQLLYSSE